MNSLHTLTAAALLAFAPASAESQPADTILETAAKAGSFELLSAALKSAELTEALAGEGPFTVFAPTDDAFTKLPAETLEALLRPENRPQLVGLLTYHVVAGKVLAKDAIAAGEASSLQGSELAFRIVDGRLRVNDASVATNDVECTNGVIHIIDSVLVPPGGIELTPPRPAGRLIIGVHVEAPSRALAEQLQVDRKGSLLVTGVTAGNPARAGLKKYDVITAFGHQPANEESLKAAKESAGYGGHIELSIIRRGKPMKLTVDVGVDPH